jgi:hypothetical protein
LILKLAVEGQLEKYWPGLERCGSDSGSRLPGWILSSAAAVGPAWKFVDWVYQSFLLDMVKSMPGSILCCVRIAELAVPDVLLVPSNLEIKPT